MQTPIRLARNPTWHPFINFWSRLSSLESTVNINCPKRHCLYGCPIINRNFICNLGFLSKLGFLLFNLQKIKEGEWKMMRDEDDNGGCFNRDHALLLLSSSWGERSSVTAAIVAEWSCLPLPWQCLDLEPQAIKNKISQLAHQIKLEAQASSVYTLDRGRMKRSKWSQALGETVRLQQRLPRPDLKASSSWSLSLLSFDSAQAFFNFSLLSSFPLFFLLSTNFPRKWKSILKDSFSYGIIYKEYSHVIIHVGLNFYIKLPRNILAGIYNWGT